MKRLFIYIFTLCFLVITLSTNSRADEVLNVLDEAVKQYKSGDYSGAASNLEYASQLIRQKKSEIMKELLPEPLPGWEAEAADARTLGTAVFGGGINVSRSYAKKSATVSIDIVSDSPVMQSLVMMINNPMLAGASGGKLETIKKQRAIVQYNESTRDGEITVKGEKVDRKDLIEYASAVDYEALAKN